MTLNIGLIQRCSFYILNKKHHYSIVVKWTGNRGTGTSNYRVYDRNHSILTENKPEILASSDPSFRGDPSRYNPEDLLVSSLSSCHMLWYLHLCSEAGVIVIDYTDHATGILEVSANGSGHFSEVTLNPIVTVTEEGMIGKASELHNKASELCFISNSVNFPIYHKLTTKADNRNS